MELDPDEELVLFEFPELMDTYRKDYFPSKLEFSGDGRSVLVDDIMQMEFDGLLDVGVARADGLGNDVAAAACRTARSYANAEWHPNTRG